MKLNLKSLLKGFIYNLNNLIKKKKLFYYLFIYLLFIYYF